LIRKKNKMLVKRSNFQSVLEKINFAGYKSLDTETTGLRAHAGDRLFSIIIADENDTYYFNFQAYSKEEVEPPQLAAWLEKNKAELPPLEYDPYSHVIPRHWIASFKPLFENKAITWFLQNAKFDLAMLARDGLRLSGDIHCTEAMARILDNSFMSYRLSELLKRMNKDLNKTGPEKMELTAKWVKDFKCYTKVEVPGKDKPVELWHAERVPPQIMIPYGMMDGFATRELGVYQGILMSKFPKRKELFHMEQKLTKALFEMEEAGMTLDHEYTARKLRQELKTVELQEQTFKALTGFDLVDSALVIAPVLKGLGFEIPQTEKGSDSVAKGFLQTVDHPVAECVIKFREARKKAGTYYGNFLYYADKENLVHSNYRQGGTTTGRLSCMEPNLQNVPKPDEDGTPEENAESREVRACFIPPKDCCLLSIDYDQMEYRLMLDEAEEMPLIKKIVEDGLDIHEATARMMSEVRKTTRKQAKTINFMLLYGGGIQKLADALGISFEESKNLKNIYFKTLPKVQKFIQKTSKLAEIEGYTQNWAGRICYIDRGFAYKAPNYKIQGGCADITKYAICMIHAYLMDKKTKLIATVHDENIFALHKDELYLAKELQNIMEASYIPKHIPLTCGVSHSWKSWGELEEGFPVGAKS
jgi:DNA polymerase-1